MVGDGFLTLNNCKVFGDSECGGTFELTIIDSYIEQLSVERFIFIYQCTNYNSKFRCNICV